jgi:hypothetical protein
MYLCLNPLCTICLKGCTMDENHIYIVLHAFFIIVFLMEWYVVGHWFTLVNGMKFDALLLYLARARLASTIGKNKL